MDKEPLIRKIAELESLNDQLQAELRYLDSLMRKVGFEGGIVALKSAALDLLEEGQSLE